MFHPYRPWAAGLTALALFCALTLVGCGDDDGDFLVRSPGAANSALSSGGLFFQFYQAQAALVSAQAQTLEFEFFDAQGELLKTVTVNYSASVTIGDVPTTASKVEITIYDENGAPLQTLLDEVAVVPGATTEVDLSDADSAAVTLESLSASPSRLLMDLISPVDSEVRLSLTALFDNGSTVDLEPDAATYQVRPEGVVSIDDQGVVRPLRPGTATVVVTLEVEGVRRTATVSVVVVDVRDPRDDQDDD